MAKRRCFLAIFGLCPFRNLFPQFNCVIKPPCADGLLTAAKKKNNQPGAPYFVHPCSKEECSSRDPLYISLCSDCSAYVQRSISFVRTAFGTPCVCLSHVCWLIYVKWDRPIAHGWVGPSAKNVTHWILHNMSERKKIWITNSVKNKPVYLLTKQPNAQPAN